MNDNRKSEINKKDQHGPFDLVVVFPGGNGTADMRRRAEAANLIIRVVQ